MEGPKSTFRTEGSRDVDKRRFHRLEVSSLVLLSIGLLLTCLATFYVYWNVQREDTSRFNDLNEQILRSIRSRIDRYRIFLIQSRGLFVANKNRQVTRREFHNYVSSMDIPKLFPGIQGVGFAQRLKSSELSSVVNKTRSEGFPEFKIWPSYPRSDYFPVIYIEPLDWRNLRAFGFDMFTEATRREAMERSWLTGEAVVSGHVTLVQETEKDQQPGFLLYVPVYRAGAPVQTEEEKRNALIGFVYSPFRSHDLFLSLFQGQHLPIDFEVFDGSTPSAKTLLFDKDGVLKYGDPAHRPRFEKLNQMEIGGRVWTIYTSTESTYVLPTARYAPFLSVLAGLIITFLLFRIFLASGRHQVELESLYENEQAARRQSESSLSDLETLNRVSVNLSAELNLQKLVHDVTNSAVLLTHAHIGAFFFHAVGQQGELYTLYASVGAPRDSISRLFRSVPASTIKMIFAGTGTIRSNDTRSDPRFEGFRSSTYDVEERLNVVSFLAAPVVSRGGEVMGGLIFGHEAPSRFSEREEKIAAGLAAQAAVAIDNARLYQRSREATAVRDEFLSICSHELKTPLTTLKLQAQKNKRILAKQNVLTEQSVNSLLNATEKQVDRLSRLVDDMLDVSRIVTGRLKVETESFELGALVREIVERLTPQIEAAGCRVKVEIVPSIVGEWDRLRIDQVVTNLITNAAKYGPGKPVYVSVTEEAGEAKISIRDEGIGIAPEHHRRIFERFERAVEDSGISGLGLGLYITRQILEAHGGNIQVESQVGQGATFIVTLPILSGRLKKAS
ncbi:MAG: CHASE domain-containing protein [Bdellovibrionia bacterium]